MSASRLLLPALGLLLASADLRADEGATAAITACAEIADESLRIECLEAAIRVLTGAGDEEAPVEISEPESEAAPQPAPDAAPPLPQSEVEELGADQLRARTETREEKLARLQSASSLSVSAYSVIPYQRLQVELENGQVWRQIKGDTQRIRVSLARNQTVDIEESSLGGFKLRLNEMGRTIRVERVR